MKKFLLIALAALMALTIVGCGKKCDNCGGRNNVREIFGVNICQDCMGL